MSSATTTVMSLKRKADNIIEGKKPYNPVKKGDINAALKVFFEAPCKWMPLKNLDSQDITARAEKQVRDYGLGDALPDGICYNPHVNEKIWKKKLEKEGSRTTTLGGELLSPGDYTFYYKNNNPSNGIFAVWDDRSRKIAESRGFKEVPCTWCGSLENLELPVPTNKEQEGEKKSVNEVSPPCGTYLAHWQDARFVLPPRGDSSRIYRTGI